MNTTIETEVQADQVEAAAAQAPVLRTLENAEMIHVGGGYCAADY